MLSIFRSIISSSSSSDSDSSTINFSFLGGTIGFIGFGLTISFEGITDSSSSSSS
jgi:hypothetical protein